MGILPNPSYNAYGQLGAGCARDMHKTLKIPNEIDDFLNENIKLLFSVGNFPEI